MNETLMRATMRQRVTSPVRVTLLASVFLFPLLVIGASPATGFTMLGSGYALTLVIAAGVIGQDVSSGVLQLLFARPVKRSEYVISRWLAVSLMSAMLATLQLAIAVLLMWSRHAPPQTREVFEQLGNSICVAFGAGAVLTFFSSLLPGFGDLAILLVMAFTGSGLDGIGQGFHLPVLSRIGDEVGHFVFPSLPLSSLLRGGGTPWYEIVAYFSTVTLCLAAAILIVNRKELSYASSS